MRKYFSILKMSFLDSFQYIPALFFKFITYFINVFVLISLWKYIYQDPSKIINGYTLKEMIWYLLMSESISHGCSILCQKEIKEDIRSGEIAYKINKPYQYLGYMIMRYFGDSIIRTIMYFLVSIIMGTIFVGKLNIDMSILSFLCICISIVLGIFINGLIKILISLSSFWTEDSSPFHWIYNKILLIFGIFFPLEMFPKNLQPIIKCTPVFVVLYGPAKLILNFSYNLFFTIVFAQLIYILIVTLLLILMYRKGVKNLNVNGG